MQETQETQVQSLGGEDPLEKEMATHSSIPALWMEEPGGLQPWSCKELDTTDQLSSRRGLWKVTSGQDGLLRAQPWQAKKQE